MSISIRRILFPTDYSPPARQAQNYALALAEKFSAELHVLHVIEDPSLPVHGSRFAWAVPDDVLPRLVQNAELEMALAVPEEHLLSIDRRPICTVKVGHPVSAIIDYAKDNDIDIIVVGTHGYRRISQLLLGSVAEKIVRLAICPVLTVHPNGRQFVAAESE